MKPVLVFPIVLLLAACGPGTKLGTLAGGECQLTHTPKYAVAGKAQPDQNWIDDTTESLVRGCGQPRPQARPASFDKQPAKPIVVQPKKKWISLPTKLPKSKPPVVTDEPPEPKDLPPMRKADPIWPPVTEPPEPPKSLDQPAKPEPVPPPTQRDWWYYLRR